MRKKEQPVLNLMIHLCLSVSASLGIS